jgi:nicotinate-nucleotide adenylyltransferase
LRRESASVRIGVFGGTFDPVHFGHLTPVDAAAARYGLARVLYVPARVSPHKQAPAAGSHDRVAMLALALAGRPDRVLWLEELDRDPPSYTVDTLRALGSEFPGDELWLLMGTDALCSFDRWREPERIVRMARIAAFLREPFTGSQLRIPDVSGLTDRLEVFDGGSVKISATELRSELAAGGDGGGRIPDPVAEYVTKQGLYGSGQKRR